MDECDILDLSGGNKHRSAEFAPFQGGYEDGTVPGKRPPSTGDLLRHAKSRVLKPRVTLRARKLGFGDRNPQTSGRFTRQR